MRDIIADYTTAILEYDGNERAGLHLRNSNLNVLHILFQQLQRKDLKPAMRTAVTDAFFASIDGYRDYWANDLTELSQELEALRRAAQKENELCLSQPKKFTPEEMAVGKDDDARRVCIRAKQWAEFD